MNWETSPIHSESGTANGISRTDSTMNVATSETRASKSREYRYAPVFSIATSQIHSTRCWRAGGRTESTVRRNRGPSAVK